ncbi:MAG: hypothetical protein K0R62_7767 [Nonomuraea muscovyensis]|nr:hypothetical protein [Nonomuraea muscovyensis]
MKFDQIAASVAPPNATNSAPEATAASRADRSNPTQSPDTNANRNPPPPPTVNNMSSNAGTEFHTDTPNRSHSCAHRPASRRSSSPISTSEPPTDNNPNTSNTDRSKSSADTASTRSPPDTPNRPTTSSTVFTAAACVISTPFGSPVDPDV